MVFDEVVYKITNIYSGLFSIKPLLWYIFILAFLSWSFCFTVPKNLDLLSWNVGIFPFIYLPIICWCFIVSTTWWYSVLKNEIMHVFSPIPTFNIYQLNCFSKDSKIVLMSVFPLGQYVVTLWWLILCCLQ